ncbi:50S ribosomal protein L4 [Desulfatitalea alkaliphila]|uniref:Large ribosomal subunit protein uL4 n=1 Tax=Desulfatitalea alkaliphila TaxID=2929485 RepID=A0AA41R764_9BACT|nr:50S ribosomal protein L4 [Desulfatitalea alkaliphila]MCJ8502911.1 50S ribosomal protein L4 [Desulfatitalea alkaliphila]
MATVDVINIQGDKVSQAELSDAIFDVPINTAVLHQVVKAQLANRRAGTAKVKNRSDVVGSTRKLYRQKGTGRARRGDIKSPLLRGGGVIFGPHPRSYAQKVPKKVRRMALKMALSSKLKDAELMVLDRLELDEIKTKAFVAACDNVQAKNALIVTAEQDRHLELSARNVPGVKVLRCEGLNVYDILKYEKLVLLEGAIKGIEGRLLS